MSNEIVRGIIRPRGIIRGEANISSLAASGQLDITSDGRFNVKQFEYANVDTSSHLAEKEITENGVYLAADDDKYGYSKVNVNILRGYALLTPLYFDYIGGYVSGGVFTRNAGETNNRNDIYVVQEGRNYKLTFGQYYGNRARAMITQDNVVEIPGTGIISRGVSLSESTNPSKQWDMYFTASMSGYMIITKDNASRDEIPTILLDMTALGD